MTRTQCQRAGVDTARRSACATSATNLAPRGSCRFLIDSEKLGYREMGPDGEQSPCALLQVNRGGKEAVERRDIRIRESDASYHERDSAGLNEVACYAC